MTIEEAIKEYGELEDFHKDEGDTIFWTGPIDRKGVILFTFDKIHLYEFFTDFPDKLTDEEIRVFCKENPYLVNHFISRKDKIKARGITI